MKKTIVVAAAMIGAAAFGDLKVGTVDMMALVKNHPSYETNKNLLQSTEKDYQRKLDDLKGELEGLQDEGKKLSDELRNPMLAATAKTKIENDLAKIQEKFLSRQQQLRSAAMRNQQELADLEARLLKAQAADLKKRIAEFADKEGYDLVIDSSAAIFAKKSYDVTPQVLKAMGVDPKVALAKEKDEGK